MADLRELSTDPAIKLSGVAALSTDNATVVALSPNSPATVADVLASGTLAAAAQTVVLSVAGGMSATAAQITGTWVGTIQFEGTLDGTNWVPINGVFAGGTAPAPTITANGVVRITPSGLASIRLNATAWTSGTATITLRASWGTGGTFLNQSLPVGGNIVGAISNTSFAVTNAGTFAAQATLAAETTKVIGTVNLSAAQTLAAVTAITNALPAGTNSIGTVQQAAITKSTQGTTGVTTQDLKDSGRVNVAITCYQAAGIITTEALFAAATFSFSRDGAAATTGQQLAVTAAKRFRMQSIVIGVKNTAAVAGTSKLALRYQAAGGAITSTSPILAILDMGSNSATANAYIGPTEMALPDCVELIANSTFGFTNLSSAVTMLHTITVNGFEY